LKTAAFPVHGWLTEVMEAPDSVSALLHAGIINSGGVLLITLSGLVQFSPGAMAALVMLGGFTALFGAAVMLTQSAVKTSLAWSTVSQMGFMLLQCGLGLCGAGAAAHLAHSLYKAHAFLSSGGAVRAVAGLRRPGPIAVPSLGAVLKSFAVATHSLRPDRVVLFAAVLGPKTAQTLALGAILIFGVAYLVAQGLADMAPWDLTKRTVLLGWRTRLPISPSRHGASLSGAARCLPPGARAAGMGADRAGGRLLRPGCLCTGAVSALGASSRHRRPAGSSRQRLYLNALLDRAIGGFSTAKSN
jgi:NAD(P)H-quinone oxidoreductase subunit 5